MHRMYECVWKCANRIGAKCPFTNKSWFLLLNTCLWVVIGLVVTAVVILIGFRQQEELEKILWELVGTGYVAVILGFGGGVMYIWRNTEPEDIR